MPPQVMVKRLVSKAEDGGGTRQEWLDCLSEIVEVMMNAFALAQVDE